MIQFPQPRDLSLSGSHRSTGRSDPPTYVIARVEERTKRRAARIVCPIGLLLTLSGCANERSIAFPYY